MKKLSVAYLKNFGTNEILKSKNVLEQKYPNIELELKPFGQQQTIDAVNEGRADIAITNLRDSVVNELFSEKLADISLMILLQAGIFDRGQQTITLADLNKIPDLLAVKTEEEAAELHYHRDILEIKSPFMAVETFNEAALMAESGSGYFIVNEKTAPAFKSQQLQKMFLLNNKNQQIKQDYSLLVKEENSNLDVIKEFGQLLSHELN